MSDDQLKEKLYNIEAFMQIKNIGVIKHLHFDWQVSFVTFRN
jgi:hypothetical protein